MTAADDSQNYPQSADVSKPSGFPIGILKNLLLLIAAVATATLLVVLFEKLDFAESNFIMVYLLAVVFVAYATEGYWYSIAASLLSVLAFNYFFTIPYFSLRAAREEHTVTFVVMLFAALATSSITARIKMLKNQSELREARLRFLNRITRELMFADDIRQIAEIAARSIADFLNASALVAVVDAESVLRHKRTAGKYKFDRIEDEVACLDAIHSGMLDNEAKATLHSGPSSHFLPLIAQGEVLGVLGVSFDDDKIITDNAKTFLDTIGTQISVALERERLRARQEQAKLAIEKERLRSDLLRGISHDLRTPLTGILGSAGALLDHYATLDDGVRLGFIKGIVDEAEWLRRMVENTLYMTRLDDSGMRLEKELHPVEEIVSGAVERCRARPGGADIEVCMPGDFIMIPVDATLVAQALINLLDNALRYSPKGARVKLRVTVEAGNAVFEVGDDGPGIPEADLDRVFDRFYTSEKGAVVDIRQKGLGLGLSVCKSIVEAHHGVITAANNPAGGAVFRFSLPMENA